MDIHTSLPLLGGLTAAQFMKQYWQKKPLLVRNAVADFASPLAGRDLFVMAAMEGVEARLVERDKDGWRVRTGPFARRALPPIGRPGWTLLVQGVNLLHRPAQKLLQQFRFVPDARLDDLMVSFATDGGGVGPHFDSYDVFLLQMQGQRQWRIGRQDDLTLRDNAPLKVLAHFAPEEEFVLNPGDMLYLPPRYAHDGVAKGDCVTYSVGFRAPAKDELARELLLRLTDEPDEQTPSPLYRDRKQKAVEHPGAVPAGLQDYAQRAVMAALREPHALARALGEYLSEPKANVWFDASEAPDDAESTGLVLDGRTRMLYDERHVFINGESYLASGRDAKLMRHLADRQCLSAAEFKKASIVAKELILEWLGAGWLQYQPEEIS